MNNEATKLTGRCLAWMTGRLNEMVKDLNKTAAKLDLPGVSVSFGEPYVAEVTVLSGTSNIPKKVRKTFVNYVLEGVAPFVDGWQVVAKIDCSHASPIIHAVNDQVTEDELLSWRQGDVTACDHCGHNRERHDVYVIRDEDSHSMQVGSTCLKDFIPKDIATLASKATAIVELVQSWDERETLGSSVPTAWPIVDFLATCLVICDIEGGFLSRSKATGDNATADLAGHLLVNLAAGRRQPDGKLQGFPEFKSFASAEDAIVDKRAEAVDLRNTLLEDIKPSNNFEFNLIAALEREFITHKEMGLVAAAIPAARIRAEREHKAERRAEEMAERASEWVGEPKQRMEFDVTLEFCTSFEGYYGLTTLMKFVTEQGDILTWFTSSPADLTVGESARIKATIKDHDQYEGEKQTKVNRVTVL
jgi:hypothetical protein